MSVYISFLGKSFKQHLAYRSEVWMRIVLSLITVGIQAAVWRALLGDGSAAEGIDLDDMITYAILNAVIALVLMDRSLTEVDDKLRTGDIAIDLIRPMHYPLIVFAGQLGQSAFAALFSVVPTVIFAALIFGLQAPASGWHAVAFVAAMIIALAVSFSVAVLVVLLAFWFLATFHFRWAIGALVTLFSGSSVPLWFYPEGWQTVARALPFQFMGFFPAATWMGELSGHEILVTLGYGILWSAALLGLCGWLWSTITRRLIVQGG